jgi:tetratricopeptide (TPR) repeat protein
MAMALAFAGSSAESPNLPIVEPSEIEQWERAVEAMLSRLQSLGLARRSEGRFQFVGGDLPRTYFKYLAARGGETTGHGRTFGAAGSFLGYVSVFIREACVGLLEAPANTVSVARYGNRTTFSSGSGTGTGLARISECLVDGRAAAGIRLGLAASFSNLAEVEKAVTDGATFVGFPLTALLDEAGEIAGDTIEVGVLLACHVPDADACRDRLREFFRDSAEALARLRVRAGDPTVGSVRADTAQRIAILLAPGSVNRRISELFAAARLDEAIAVADGTIELWTAEELSVITPDKDERLADLYNRAGFLRAVSEQFDEARNCLHEALRLSPDMWLATYNLLYISAQEKDWEGALSLIDRLRNLDSSVVGGPVMLVYFPIPDEWEPPGPRWNVVTLEPQDLERFIELQGAVIEVSTGGPLDPVVSLHAAQPPIAHAVQHRLLGWALLSGGRTAEAVEAFERASRARGATEAIGAELQYAQALVEERT